MQDCLLDLRHRDERARGDRSPCRSHRRIISAPRAAETKLLFESGSPGRSAFLWPDRDRGESRTPFRRLCCVDDIAGFPELGELEVLRHFTRLSQRNFAIESQFYPLGSCTMKYNPKINEVVARFPGFAQIHPLAPADLLQGALALLYELERMLAEISGMEQVSLQPSAGAQGELTGLMLIRACLDGPRQSAQEYHRARYRAWHQSGELDACAVMTSCKFLPMSTA